MKKRVILVILGLVIVIAVLAGVKWLQIAAMIKQGKSYVPPPETVTAVPVKADSWTSDLTAVGSLTAVQGVTVASDLSGKVVKIAFEPGGQVKNGDLLVRQDTSSEEAQLPGAVAQAKQARSELERSKKLVAENIISQSDYDKAAVNLRAGPGTSQQYPGHHQQEDDSRAFQRSSGHPPGKPGAAAP